MSRNETNNKAEPAELPDNVDIESGANYQLDDPCKPINPQQGFKYTAAATNDPTHPHSVENCLRKGWEVCAVESCTSVDCKLMRMPVDKWERMDGTRKGIANRAALAEGHSLQGVPEASTYRTAEHGQVRKAK